MIERLRIQIPAGAAGEFSSPKLTLCADLFAIRSTPVLPQWHVKDPGHFAKIAGGRPHLNTHTLLTQRSRSGLALPLSRYCVGTYLEGAHTQLVREHSVTVVTVSSLSHYGLILA